MVLYGPLTIVHNINVFKNIITIYLRKIFPKTKITKYFEPLEFSLQTHRQSLAVDKMGLQ